jgi:hypothetical protein
MPAWNGRIPQRPRRDSFDSDDFQMPQRAEPSPAPPPLRSRDSFDSEPVTSSGWQTTSLLFNDVVARTSAAAGPKGEITNPAQRIAPLSPFQNGSSSALYKCVIKRPEITQMWMHCEFITNADDVYTQVRCLTLISLTMKGSNSTTSQFLGELRLYRTVGLHRHIPSFIGCLDGIGMVLESIEGSTLHQRIESRPPVPDNLKISWFNQLLEALCHIHSFGLSHGDINSLNVLITNSSDQVKLIDFGRSTLHGEVVLPSSRPFCAPEILRADRGKMDAKICDAYSLGILLTCFEADELIDVEPEIQMSGEWVPGPKESFKLFGELITGYTIPWPEMRLKIKADQEMKLPS